MKTNKTANPPTIGEAAYTPTPWKVDNPATLSPALHPFPAIQSARSGKMIADTCEHGSKGAANSHAALVAASTEFLDAAKQVRQLKDGVSIQISAAASSRYMQAEEELRAALKAATT